MVRCNFCGTEIKLGRGTIYAKKDGTTFNFCSSKCEKNQIVLKRKPAKTKWTVQHNKLKQTMIAAKEHEKAKNAQVLPNKVLKVPNRVKESPEGQGEKAKSKE